MRIPKGTSLRVLFIPFGHLVYIFIETYSIAFGIKLWVSESQLHLQSDNKMTVTPRKRNHKADCRDSIELVLKSKSIECRRFY